jgi:hypothetical protein
LNISRSHGHTANEQFCRVISRHFVSESQSLIRLYWAWKHGLPAAEYSSFLHDLWVAVMLTQVPFFFFSYVKNQKIWLFLDHTGPLSAFDSFVRSIFYFDFWPVLERTSSAKRGKARQNSIRTQHEPWIRQMR